MFSKRLILATVAAAAMLSCALISGLFGALLCSPGWLPGDWEWSLQQDLARASGLVFSFAPASSRISCFTGSMLGLTATAVAANTLAALGLFLLAFGLWVTALPPLHRWRLRQFGGHAIVAGEPDRIAPLVLQQRARGPIVFLAVDPDNRRRLSWRFWTSLVEAGYDSSTLGRALRRLGATKARFIAAASTSDLSNIEISNQAIAAAEDGRHPSEILLQIENPVLRNLKAHEIVHRGSTQSINVTPVSISQLQIRQGLRLGIPYAFQMPDARRIHIVVAGSGRLLQQLAMQLAAQAYVKGTELPLLTVLQIGSARSTGDTFNRLRNADLAVDFRLIVGDADDESGLSVAIGQVGLDRNPPSAVHCVGDSAGEAEAFAGAWERVLTDLGIAVPPIVIYPAGEAKPDAETFGSSGMFRWSSPVNLVEAQSQTAALDEHAQAIHRNYQEQQSRQLGATFGTQRTHVSWAELPGEAKDDNRAAADHLESKLLIVGCRSAKGAALPAATLQPTEIETLSYVEHARWVAKRAIEGWTFAPQRDDLRRRHPSLVPYNDLTEPEKQKDRDNIVLTPQLLRLVDRRIVRDFSCGILIGYDALPSIAPDALAQTLIEFSRRRPDRHLLIWFVLHTAALPLAESLTSAGLSIAFVEYGAPGKTLGAPDDDRMARARHLADRIHVIDGNDRVEQEKNARAHLVAICDAAIVDAGTIELSSSKPIAIWSKDNAFADLGWLS